MALFFGYGKTTCSIEIVNLEQVVSGTIIEYGNGMEAQLFMTDDQEIVIRNEDAERLQRIFSERLICPVPGGNRSRRPEDAPVQQP
jgi:hypothetical protein